MAGIPIYVSFFIFTSCLLYCKKMVNFKKADDIDLHLSNYVGLLYDKTQDDIRLSCFAHSYLIGHQDLQGLVTNYLLYEKHIWTECTAYTHSQHKYYVLH